MADILNIPTTLLLGDGAGQHAVGSIGEYLAERIASRSIVNYATQLAPIDWLGSTMVRIRKKLIVQSEQYGDGSSPKQNAQIQEQDFPINKFRTIKIKFETFDEIALQNDMGYQAWVIDTIQPAIELDLAGLFFGEVKNLIFNNPKRFVKLPSWADPSTDDATAKSDSKKWAFECANIEKLCNRIVQFPNGEEIITFMDKYGQINRVAGLTTGNAGDKAIEFLQDGQLTPAKLWGCNYLINNLLNNIIPANVAVAKDYDIDTTTIPAIILYRGALALPNKIFSAISLYDPLDGNPCIIVKYKYDFISIYPELCSAIITTDPTGTVQPDWIFIQGGQIEITGTGNVQRNVVVYPNTTQQDAYNVSSGDATIATATKSGNTITITGVAVGTTTITVVSTVDPTKTRTLQVVVK